MDASNRAAAVTIASQKNALQKSEQELADLLKLSDPIQFGSIVLLFWAR